MTAFSRLYVTVQCKCLLHCEHGCSVDRTQLVQLIAVGCLVMRDGQCCNMSCHIVSVQVCTEGSVSRLFVPLCYQYMFL